MGRKEKLIERFCRLPRDFTFEEVEALFSSLGFTQSNKGKTSGSRIMFNKEDMKYRMHKPHPQNQIKPAALKDLYNYLKENNLI